jgi:hypothetical protein
VFSSLSGSLWLASLERTPDSIRGIERLERA